MLTGCNFAAGVLTDEDADEPVAAPVAGAGSSPVICVAVVVAVGIAAVGAVCALAIEPQHNIRIAKLSLHFIAVLLLPL